MSKIQIRKASVKDFDPSDLAAWYWQYRHTEADFMTSEEAVKDLFDGLRSGRTSVWVATSAELNGENNERAAKVLKEDPTSRIEGVLTSVVGDDVAYRCVSEPEMSQRKASEFRCFAARSQSAAGAELVAVATRDTFKDHPDILDMYVGVSSDNHSSRDCFLQAGFHEVLAYRNPGKQNFTTVLKVTRPTRVVGIQSGNAVDGIDVCIVDFDEPTLPAIGSRDVQSLAYSCMECRTYSWPESTREQILKARDGLLGSVDLAKLNYELGECFAEKCLQLITDSGIDIKSVDLVSSHGQSICGHPHWEFGELSVIAQRTGIKAAGDFRPADVAAGGNGSPCTCSFDALMLRPPAGQRKWRTCINIGGTTSVTFCPPIGSTEHPIGLDPGIGVFFMDLNAQSSLGKPFDDGGALAKSGKLHDDLLSEMLQHPHFQRRQLPISIGAEDFPRSLFAKWKARSQELALSDADFQATLCELTARSLALAAHHFGPRGKLAADDIVVRGGVRHNTHFMERLRLNLSRQLGEEVGSIKCLEDVGLAEDSWETVMYAMFGFLCSRGLNNFVPSCTGASKAVSGGKMCLPGSQPLARCT